MSEEKGHLHQYDEVIMEPYKYLTEQPTNTVITKLGTAFNHWLNIPNDKLQKINDIANLVHESGLLLDDLQDDAGLRRGAPVAQLIFGPGLTLNSGSQTNFFALGKTLELDHPKAVKVYYDGVMGLHRGQGVEIYWRDSMYCPTEEEYRDMAIGKYGQLFVLGINMMKLFSNNKTDYTDLINKFSYYYCIRNDYGNLYLKEYSDNKTFCEDITDGKFSFPLMHAYRKEKGEMGNSRVFNILAQRTKNLDVKRYCVSLLEKHGSFQYTRNVLSRLDKELRDEVVRLGGNEEFIELLDRLSSWKKDYSNNILKSNGAYYD